MRKFVSPLILIACAACGPAVLREAARTGGQDRPVPTEHRLDSGAERRSNDGRKAWIEEMHRSAPDVDWRAIERDNGRLEQERRNLIGRTMATGGATQWTEIGSSNLAGRMHVAQIGPGGDRLYAGSALGGVWRGGLDGTGWAALGDNLFGGVNDLTVLPGENTGEPDVIVVATDGGLVHVSRDEGLTWEVPGGIGTLWSIRGLATLQDAARTILLYARGPGTNYKFTLLASTDYGRNFSIRWQSTSSWEGWMWVPRKGAAAATHVYVADQGMLRKSANGGLSFTNGGHFAAGSDRAVLVGSEAGAPRLYVAAPSGGQWKLYRSDNAGDSWTFKVDIPDFWETLQASLINADVVAFAGLEAYVSTNGGGAFTRVNEWWEYYGDPVHKLHADIPGLHAWPDPVLPNRERWYVSTDGGLFTATSLSLGVANISLQGLGVSQYYSTLSSTTNWDRISVGSQDQGYQVGIVQHGAGGGPSTPLEQIISGDYGHLTSNDGSAALVYSTYPGFVLIQDGPVDPALYDADFPVGASHSWLPPVVADPIQPGTFFFCGELLYRYDRTGTSSWAPTVHSPYPFGVSGGTYLSALAFAPTDPNRVYAANDAGGLFHSADHGSTWTKSVESGPSQHYFYGTAIAVHLVNPDEVAVGGSGYSTPGVVRSTDGGSTWQDEVVGLPSTLVYDLAYDPDGNLYAATEAGAFRWDRASAMWQAIGGNQAPATLYWSVEVVNDGGTARFGTYGRGIWDYSSAADDRDGDGVVDTSDVCPNNVDAAQLDTDGDGPGDACDNCPDLADLAQTDADGDDAGDACDCAPTNPGIFAVPPEATGLAWPTNSTLNWISLLAASGSSGTHVVFRGALGEFPVGASSSCSTSQTQGISLTDPQVPSPGAGFWYLVQGSNACGDGALGTWGSGIERATPTCN